MTKAGPYVAVVGGGEAGEELCGQARDVGRLLAERGAVVVCGGLGGVMEAVCRGVADGGGVSIGLLPGADRTAANRWVTYTVPTGMGEGRNALVARSADVMIAVGGEYGTLSEIALALRAGIGVVGIGTWDLDDVVSVTAAAEAVDRALALVAR
jgi:uncharacterized protein (TIGR00725 family)